MSEYLKSFIIVVMSKRTIVKFTFSRVIHSANNLLITYI